MSIIRKVSTIKSKSKSEYYKVVCDAPKTKINQEICVPIKLKSDHKCKSEPKERDFRRQIQKKLALLNTKVWRNISYGFQINNSHTIIQILNCFPLLLVHDSKKTFNSKRQINTNFFSVANVISASNAI